MINSDFRILKNKRRTVQVILKDGRVIQGLRSAPIVDFFKTLPEWKNPPIVGAVINSELRELTFPVEHDVEAELVTTSSSDGSKIYRRSLTFLLQAAFEKQFHNKSLIIDYSIPSGGYFCEVDNGTQLTPAEITNLELLMRSMVKNDVPIERETIPIKEAIQYFESKNQSEKIRLLKYRQKQYLVLYKLGQHRDYHHGYMVPSTGYLDVFSLVHREDGFILQYPRRKTPTQLFPMPEYDKLIDIFRQYGGWLTSLGIDTVGALNDAIVNNKIREIVLVSEALHEQNVASIAARIAAKGDQIKAVLISGPSSSGKTTFSKRLSIQLLTYGISPFPLEMDNYFVDRDKTPRDENGEYNFESFEAIDADLLEKHVQGLLNGEKVRIPHYDFVSGSRKAGDEVQLTNKQVIIIEGIHGLNPKLLSHFPSEKIYRLYVSCLTQLNLDRSNRISTTDTRLLRRIVRDERTRGYSAQHTIQMWDSVRKGEREYIFRHQENADEIFNSALVYELAAIKPLAEPLLRLIPHGSEEFLEAKRLLAFLEWFLPIDGSLIPDNSILREFVGGSMLQDFKLWEPHGK